MNFIKTGIKTTSAILVLAAINCFSYAQDSSYHKMSIKMTDSEGKIEFVPDLYVTYKCKEYVSMDGLAMKPNSDKTEVTVNYGGLGRRRGFRDFKCLSK